MARKPKKAKQVRALKHEEATRKNIPTGELQPIAEMLEEQAPVAPVTYKRARPLAEGETRPRDADADPQIIWRGARLHLTPEMLEELQREGSIEIGDAQLTWRGKDEQDWSDLVVQVPPIYVQEKIHPKAIIDDLKRQADRRAEAETEAPDLFGDFDGIEPEAVTEFYQHDQNWSNRMILGDSLQVMASLAEREALRGKVQCIYFDPPYGIKFNSNWQVSTRSRDVKDGKLDQITREPEQVKAFRDTWKDGIHSYLTYLRDRLTVMRDMLTESGSIFVQIGDENVHRVRALMDEVFGEENFVVQIEFKKKGAQKGALIENILDTILFYCRNKENVRYLHLFNRRDADLNAVFSENITGGGTFATQIFEFEHQGRSFSPAKNNSWSTAFAGMRRIQRADRIIVGRNQIRFARKNADFPNTILTNIWEDTGGAPDRRYVVETSQKVIQRCILMATDPGDLVLDPTCGSGTTATVAEQWGRRWITIDTSRVALALARARLMGARYPYYLLADSREGRDKEQAVSGKIQPDTPTNGDVRQGFVYERAPHITLKSIANNAEIDVIWEKWQQTLEPLRTDLNAALGRKTAEGGKRDRAPAGQAAPAEPSPKATGVSDKEWEEWEIPRENADDWPDAAKSLHEKWWEARIARQKEIDASIARKADVEYLYDRPYQDASKVRVAGPFTVESLSPHRVVSVDDEVAFAAEPKAPGQDFASMVLENLRAAGVHQAAKDDRIAFTAIEGWPGEMIAAVGHYTEGHTAEGGKRDRAPADQAAPAEPSPQATGASEGTPRRAGIMIGPEFGSVTRSQLTAAAREAAEARFDALIACGFNFDAHASELSKLGPLPILKAKMNPDLHMADDLRASKTANLFIVFGEPDIDWRIDEDGEIVVEVLGVDVFDPKSGDIRASGKDDIAAWFIDTDYNEESFFVRHAYFMGANDPYKSLKTALKAEIDAEAWETLYRDVSRPFPKPASGRFAVKVINHFGDEVMKVFEV